MTEAVPLYAGKFLSTLFYIVIFYYLSKFLFKWWLKRKVESHAQKMQNSVDEQEAASAKQRQGNVSIKQPGKGNNTTTDSGEYVDFEEIK